jgi:hypothetical protein
MNTTFKFVEENKETITVHVSSMSCDRLDLPNYCKHNGLWTKAIPATTSFTIPTNKKEEFRNFIIKNKNNYFMS